MPTCKRRSVEPTTLSSLQRREGFGWHMIRSGVSSTRYTFKTPKVSTCGQRLLVTRPRRRTLEEPKDKWNYNADPFDGRVGDDQIQLPMVNANKLEKETQPPVGVKMLVRDFIEDSLYNPNYGYFPKQATIFNTEDTTFDFPNIRDSAEFQEEVAAKYAAYGADSHDGPGRQLWHTPTELFKVSRRTFICSAPNLCKIKPWYGRAVGRCLVSEYLLKYFPYEDFVIYEIGAGNGTLALDILNLLQQDYPDVYERTRYNIIEISGSLAQLQRQRLQNVHPCIKITHKSVFHWNITEPSPCFFIAMEVIVRCNFMPLFR